MTNLKKEIFFEENRDFFEVKTNTETVSIGELQDIDELDDEVWIMQCPKGMDPKLLEGEKMKLPGRTNIDESETVAVEFSSIEKLAFGFCDTKGRYSLRLLPIKGSITMRNKLKAKDVITAEHIEKSCRSTISHGGPKNGLIKVRHPLFGVKFEEKLCIPKNISERLKNNEQFSVKAKKRSLGNIKDSVHRKKPRKKSKTDLDDVSTDLQWLKNL